MYRNGIEIPKFRTISFKIAKYMNMNFWNIRDLYGVNLYIIHNRGKMGTKSLLRLGYYSGLELESILMFKPYTKINRPKCDSVEKELQQYKKNLIKNIKEIKKENKMTFFELGFNIGVNEHLLSQYCTGHRNLFLNIPGILGLRRLSKRTVDELFE